MITDYTSTHPITAGAIYWPSGHQRITVIAKLSLVAGRDETFRFGEAPEPLSLDLLNEQGELIYPSDFAPYKPRCDLAIVGHAIPDRLEPGLLSVAGLRKNAEARETLGPRETFCMGGDPTEPAAIGVWSTGGVDFSRFQSAPPDRRVDWPTMAFQVDYWRSAVRMSGRFEGPVPRASLISADGSRVVARIPLAMDTVLLDPLLRQLTLLFRGVYSGAEGGRVAFDLTGNSLPELRNLATLEVTPLATPASARRPVKLAERSIRVSDQTQYMTSTPTNRALPFAPAGDRAPELTQTVIAPEPQDVTKTVSPLARARASTLPFKRGTTPSRGAPLTGAELAALRAEGATPVRSAWEADGETQYVRPSQTPRALVDDESTLDAPSLAQRPSVSTSAETARMSEPPRGVPTSIAEPAPFRVSEPARAPLGFSSPLGASPLGARVDPVPVASRVATVEQDEARVQEILQEVWKGERALSDILEQHGLTEVEWRILKRSHKKR